MGAETASVVHSHWIQTQLGRIHYRASFVTAEKCPVVLIHGLIVSGTYMIPTAECLAPRFLVYIPDLPGYGKSYKPTEVLTVSELVDALADWMDTLKIARAHLVGNSFGCQIIVEFAVRYPKRLGRLVLQGPTVDPAARSIGKQFLRLLINSRREQRSMGRITIDDYRSAGLRRICGTIKLALRDRIETKLAMIRAPTLVVRGERDPLVPQRWAEEVTELLPNGQLLVVANAAHTLNYSVPEKFAAAIIPFLSL